MSDNNFNPPGYMESMEFFRLIYGKGGTYSGSKDVLTIEIALKDFFQEGYKRGYEKGINNER